MSPTSDEFFDRDSRPSDHVFYRLIMLTSNDLRVTCAFVIVAIVCSFLPECGQAQARGPRIKTQQEIYDFGIVPQLSEVSHVFWLKNTGDEILMIDKLIPNCGCTEAPLEKNRVEPGDSSRVELVFGSSTYQGEIKKFAQIVSNAQGRAPALTFTANVVTDSDAVGPLVATPCRLNLNEDQPEADGDGWVARFTLKNSGDIPISVTTLDKPDRTIETDGFDGILGPGEGREVTLRFNAGMPDQFFSKSLTFLAAGPVQQRLTVPIFKKKPPVSTQAKQNTKVGGGS